MIPYDDLVMALHRWREKQGLPTLTPAIGASSTPAGFAPPPAVGHAPPPDAWAPQPTAVTRMPPSGVDYADEMTSAGTALPGRGDERTGELDLDTADVVEDEI